MSAKVSAVGIGAFIAGALILVVGTLVFFGGMGLFGSHEEREQAVVVFTGSVKGLSVGAPVTLRGVKIGEVRAINIRPDPKSHEFVIPVTVAINARDLGMKPSIRGESVLQPLIARGLRAQLKTQSLLTGLLYVDFDFLPGSNPRYVEYRSDLPQIPTAPTGLEAILQRVSDIDIQAFMQHADESLKALNNVLTNPEIQNIPANVNSTLRDARQLMGDVDQQVQTLGVRVTALVNSTDQAVGGAREDIALLTRHADGTLKQLDATLADVRRAAGGIDYTLSDQSPLIYELQRSVAELGRAARALQALADSIEREPESLLRGKSADRED